MLQIVGDGGLNGTSSKSGKKMYEAFFVTFSFG